MGIGFYFLSKEDNEVALDFNGKHSVKNLITLLKELNLEYICMYTRYYSMMLKMKEQGKLNPNTSHRIEMELSADMAKKNHQILLQTEGDRDEFKKGLTVDGLRKWTEHFKDHEEIKKLAVAQQKLHEEVFVKFKVEEIAFELPEKLDKQMYMKIYRKIWATIRHDLWVRIQEEKKKQNSVHIPEDKFNSLYAEVHDTFETIRMEIYSKLMGEDVERHTAREFMQKAYIKFATLSMDRN